MHLRFHKMHFRFFKTFWYSLHGTSKLWCYKLRLLKTKLRWITQGSTLVAHVLGIDVSHCFEQCLDSILLAVSDSSMQGSHSLRIILIKYLSQESECRNIKKENFYLLLIHDDQKKGQIHICMVRSKFSRLIVHYQRIGRGLISKLVNMQKKPLWIWLFQHLHILECLLWVTGAYLGKLLFDF